MIELSLLSSTILITEVKHSFDMWVTATKLLICILAFIWSVPLPSYFILNINFICSTIHFVLYVHTSCNSCLCKWQVLIQWPNQEYQLLEEMACAVFIQEYPLINSFPFSPLNALDTLSTWNLMHVAEKSREIFFFSMNN